jgi:hypothetical protein
LHLDDFVGDLFAKPKMSHVDMFGAVVTPWMLAKLSRAHVVVEELNETVKKDI